MNWAANVGAGPALFHGDAALMTDSCVHCHDRGDTEMCTVCHRAGRVGGNLHPTSFLKSYRISDVQPGRFVTIPGGITLHCTACHTV